MIHLTSMAGVSVSSAFLQGLQGLPFPHPFPQESTTAESTACIAAWCRAAAAKQADWRGGWQRMVFLDIQQHNRHHAGTFSIFRCDLQCSVVWKSFTQAKFKKKKKGIGEGKHYDKNPPTWWSELEQQVGEMEGHSHLLWRTVSRAEEAVRAKFSICIRDYAQTPFSHPQTLPCRVCTLISHSAQYFCIRHMGSTRSLSMTHYLHAKCHEHLRVFYTWNAIFGSTKWVSFASNVSNTEKNKWQF